MKRNQFLSLTLLLVSAYSLNAQTDWQPGRKELAGPLHFLSSPLLEGRETGERGSFIAAEYIASVMEQYGLLPAGDLRSGEAGWYQDFDLVKNTAEKISFTLWPGASENNSLSLMPGVDFAADELSRGFTYKAPLVFAGYGISVSGYDDYKGLDVKGKIVVALNGIPKELGNDPAYMQTSVAAKRLTAARHGALALVIAYAKDDFATGSRAANKALLAEPSQERPFPLYTDALFSLPVPEAYQQTPCFKLNEYASRTLFRGKNAAEASVSSFRSMTACISAAVEGEALTARNVLGMIKGKDTTRYVVVSAHYDHLGRRNETVYPGADDNASGVSGLLALAKHWVGRDRRPPCNIIFAAWTAEEKGMLGSKYFVQNFAPGKEALLFNMNFDMISRSDPEDIACNILSIGILKGRSDLSEMAGRYNAALHTDFDLDIWETEGNGGSDYISFSGHGIPVMAFFTGLHGDYHSPWDTRDRIDWSKMIRVVRLANSCLQGFLETIR